MEISVVYLYQSAKTGDRKRNQMFFDPTVKETGCERITFEKGMVKVESSKWPEDVYIGLANIRSMNAKKESKDANREHTGASAPAAATTNANPAAKKKTAKKATKRVNSVK